MGRSELGLGARQLSAHVRHLKELWHFWRSFLSGKFLVLNFDGNCYMSSFQIWLLRSESAEVEKIANWRVQNSRLSCFSWLFQWYECGKLSFKANNVAVKSR